MQRVEKRQAALVGHAWLRGNGNDVVQVVNGVVPALGQVDEVARALYAKERFRLRLVQEAGAMDVSRPMQGRNGARQGLGVPRWARR